MQSHLLTGKHALVTGSSRGIGRAIALRLAQDGADVTVHCRGRREEAESVAQQIRAAGRRANVLQADLGDQAAVRAMLHGIEGLDILINNAGWAAFGPLEQVTEADFDAMFQINVRGLFFLTQAALPLLRDGGRIINISSGITRINAANGSVYAATKCAVEAFTRAWAVELGPRGITVNTVSPGMTNTDLLREGVPPEAVQAIVAQTPLGRLGQPADVADAVALLCTEGARWITANNLLANGGV